MHLLGRDIAMSVTFPDGRDQDLIKIDDWDFNWQYSYFFEKPLDLPKGSVLNVVSHFDNSDVQPPQSQQAAQAGQVGRGDHRRDVRRIHRGDQEGPGPDATRREGRPHGDLPQAAGRVPAAAREGDQGSPGEGRLSEAGAGK